MDVARIIIQSDDQLVSSINVFGGSQNLRIIFEDSDGHFILNISSESIQDTGPLDNYVSKYLFDANTILAANLNNSPIALEIPESTLIGRLSGGIIQPLSATQVKELLNISGEGFANPMTATADLIVGGPLGVASRLAKGSANQVLKMSSDGNSIEWATNSGSGDVSGPASSTDNAIARFDGATGKILQNSGVLISDGGDIL
ncbi:MAG: hypothetical protein PHT77_11015, partial [Bacteroidales bacterium]|nr:hypothetical protein [Bacteroidales bacterium]